MTGYVYFLTNYTNTVIYIGVTSNLPKRIWEHREEVVEGFTRRYKVKKLVYYEVCEDIAMAIVYEKKLKNLRRAQKIAIIGKHNPEWRDLFEEICR